LASANLTKEQNRLILVSGVWYWYLFSMAQSCPRR